MSLADGFDALLLDLDGVVWRGESAVPGAASVIAALRERDKQVVFVTNNSSRTTRDYAMKLMRMNIPTGMADIVTSGHAVVAELRRLGLGPGDRVHVNGGDGLMRLLARERFLPTPETDDVKAVVVGWNPKVTFDDIRHAADLVREGLPFLASNADATYPSEEGVLPGTGAILAAVETAAGRAATVVGKPRADVFRLALERAGTSPERTLVCGDRPETDIVGAREAGLPVALVLSGVTSDRDLGRLPVVPEEILDGLGELLDDEPRPAVEHRGAELAAVAERELATLQCTRDGTRVVLGDIRLQNRVDAQRGWRAVRRLLIEATAGMRDIEAAPSTRPYLERIGIDAHPQRSLFKP